MKANSLLSFLFLSALFCSCSDRPSADVPEGFREEITLKTTPVKDRGKSPVDWCCAMLAVIETEHLMQGDSVNLSFDYVMRCWLRRQSEEYFRSKGNSGITVDGIGPMVPILLRQYGCLPYDSYRNTQPVNYNVLVRRMKMLADVAIARGDTEGKCLKAMDDLLDKEVGYLPKNVYMLRAQYTPLEFAHSVCGKDEYMTIVPSENEEYGETICLDSSKIMNCTGQSMPRDTVFNYIRESLSARHPVMWTSDSSEDEAVAIVGLGHDMHGKEYFVAKDSRGADDRTCGRLYIPASYVRSHTAFAVVKRNLLRVWD